MEEVPPVGSILQLLEHSPEGAVLDPALEVAVAGDVGHAEVVGQVAPAAASREHVQHPVDHLLEVSSGAPLLTMAHPEQRRNELKLLGC